jgi:phosphate-selective porin OprO/OprP
VRVLALSLTCTLSISSGSLLAKNDELDMKFSHQVMLDADYLIDWYDEPNDSLNSEFRRLNSELSVSNGNWQFKGKVDIDASDNKIGIADLYVKYKGWDYASLIMGHHKEPFGMESFTSSTQLVHIEKSMASQVFYPGRNNGVSVQGQFKNTDWWLGLYDNNNYHANGGAITAKINAQLDEFQHGEFRVGGSFSARALEGHEYDLDSYLETHSANDVFDTKKNALEAIELFSIDTLWYRKNLLFSCEWQKQNLSLADGLAPLEHSGFYLQGSYLIGDIDSIYQGGKGKLASPKLSKETRLWEVSVRHSQLDTLDSELGTLSDNWTLGLNYYYGKDIKFMSGYTYSESDFSSGESKQQGNAVSFRVQLTF